MTADEKRAAFALLCDIQDYLDDGFSRERRMPSFIDDGAFAAGDVDEGKSETAPRAAGGVAPALGDSPAKLADETLVCRKCRLAASRSRPVLGDGVPDPLVLVVGDAPSRDDDSVGRPFSGESGALLDRMLEAIGLSRASNCHAVTMVKCAPPLGREPLPDESRACFGFLERQIALLRPRFILAAGRAAAQALLGSGAPISELHGVMGDFRGIPVMPVFHPEDMIAEPALKRPAWEDLKRFKEAIDG